MNMNNVYNLCVKCLIEKSCECLKCKVYSNNHHKNNFNKINIKINFKNFLETLEIKIGYFGDTKYNSNIKINLHNIPKYKKIKIERGYFMINPSQENILSIYDVNKKRFDLKFWKFYNPIYIANDIDNIECNIINLDNLQSCIECLDCSDKNIKQYDFLQKELIDLEIIGINSNIFDNLPQGLKKLICISCNIQRLDNLPMNLEYLDCSRNNLKQLNNLPMNLEYLYCSYNKLEQLDYLPESLFFLDCSHNKIKSLMNLPSSLKKLQTGRSINFKKMYLPKGLIQFNEAKFGNNFSYETHIISGYKKYIDTLNLNKKSELHI